MRLCFIPARGGSKRVPRKNVLPLGGRPLIAWTIDAARESGLFDEIVVSSDDAEIISVAEAAGARGDLRPLELGGDRVRFVEVLAEFLLRPVNAGRFTELAVLLPTCPFRNADDIRAAAALRNEDDFVVSISAYEFPPDFACDFTDGLLQVRRPEVYAHSTQSQSRPSAFHPNGAIYFGPVPRFLATRSFFVPPVRGYLMPPERGLDIDLPHHFTIAAALVDPHKSPAA